MAANTNVRIQAFRAQVLDKIQALLNEFAQGGLNQEQFNALYERYSGQLALAQEVMVTGDESAMRQAQDGASIAIRAEHMGKAMGLVIYHNKTGASIETLGEFKVSAFVISPVLQEFSRAAQAGQAVEPRVEKLQDRQWLLFSGGRYTTVVTYFKNEPSPYQIREIKRLHADFEIANSPRLTQYPLDSKKMAYPFVVFVQQKLRHS